MNGTAEDDEHPLAAEHSGETEVTDRLLIPVERRIETMIISHSRSWLRRILAPVTAAAMAACAGGPDDQALSDPGAFVGMPRETLLACAGTPQSQLTVGDTEYLTYSSGAALRSAPELPGFRGPGLGQPRREGSLFGSPAIESGSGADRYVCEARFALRDGVVQELVYAGEGGAGSCHAMLERCAPRLPRRTGSAAPGG